MADDREALEKMHKERMLPTCPPELEYDEATKHMHFTFRRGTVANIGKLAEDEQDDLSARASLSRRPHQPLSSPIRAGRTSTRRMKPS